MANEEANDNQPVRPSRPVIESIKPSLEVPSSFSADISIEFEGPPIMDTSFNVLFRPRNNWRGSEYGIDWVRIGDSRLWNDRNEEDHLVHRIGKYYKTNSVNISSDKVEGTQTLTFPNLTPFLAPIKHQTTTLYLEYFNYVGEEKLVAFASGTGTPSTSEQNVTLLPGGNIEVLYSASFSLTINGELGSSFAGIDDADSTPPKISGVFSGQKSETLTRLPNVVSETTPQMAGTLTTQTPNVGIYGNDLNDYRYTQAVPQLHRSRASSSYESPNTTFAKLPNLYKRMLKENFPISFLILWKARQQRMNNRSLPNDPIDKAIMKSKIVYSVPILFLKKDKTAELQILTERIHQNQTPTRLEFREQIATDNMFDISPFEGNINRRGSVKITCLNTFSDFKYIDAYAIYEDGEKTKEVHCGQLRIHPNKEIRILKILFVEVENGNKNGTPFLLTSRAVQFMRNIYEDQALLSLDITILPDPLNMTNSTHSTPILQFNSKYGNTYDQYIKVFFLKEDGTCQTQYEFRSIVMRTTPNPLYETLAHEMGHALGLPHTFTAKEIGMNIAGPQNRKRTESLAKNAEFTYQGRRTENIMDYSHVPNENFEATEASPSLGRDGNRFALYYWQIRRIWAEVDLLNGASSTIPREQTNETKNNQYVDAYLLNSSLKI